jgi:hypothetical protein
VITKHGFERGVHWINLPSHWNWYSSVSVVIRLQTGQTGELSFDFLRWKKIILFSTKPQTGAGAHPPSCANFTGDYFLGVMRKKRV